MRILPWIDRKKNKIVHRFSPPLPPTTESLGFPPFSVRIVDRHNRWFKQNRPHWVKSLAGKSEGIAYMAALGHAVPQTYARLSRISDLPDLTNLPDRYVVKPERGYSSKGVYPMRDGVNLFDRRHMSREDIVTDIGRDSTAPHIVEELLENFDGRIGAPYDYKYYCFGSQVAMILVMERNSVHKISHNRIWCRGADWEKFPFRISWDQHPELMAPPRPPFLDEMTDIVRAVAGQLNIFVRIDMYATTRGPVFGEFTAFPSMGKTYTPRADAWLGSLWKGDEGCEQYADDQQMERARAG